jgi:hypothetical protein
MPILPTEREYLDFMNNASTGTIWLVAGVVALVLWFLIALPIFYRVIFVPLGGNTWWQQVGKQPGWALIFAVLLFAVGPVTTYLGIFAVSFAIMCAVFRVVFLMLLSQYRPRA